MIDHFGLLSFAGCFCVLVNSWRVRLAKREALAPPGRMVSPLVCRGPWMSTVVLCCLCHSDGASVLLYFTFQFQCRGFYDTCEIH